MASERKGDDASAGASAAPDIPASADATEKEFAPLVAAASAEARELAAGGNLTGALEKLLALEKKTRTAGDAIGTSKLAVLMVQLAWEARDHEALNAYVQIICKRRAQHRRVVQAVVTEAVKYVDEIEDLPRKIDYINTLRTVSAGKIFVEVERARLTKTLAEIRENEGKLSEASEILQEVAVETYGAMDKREKAEFLLEQLRLCLLTKDIIRTGMIANKVSKKILDEEGFEDIRERYYKLLIQLHTLKSKPLALAKDWDAIYTTRGVRDTEKGAQALQHVALFVALSPFDNEQYDMLQRVTRDKRLEDIPGFQALLKHFTTQEIAPWPLPQSAEIDAFMTGVDGDWSGKLHQRVVQHNVRVISKCYKRIRFARFAQLIGLSEEDAEKALAEMVTEKMVYSRIDRPAGIISFQKKPTANATLTAWADDIGELLGLVETTCHLINKEHMIHKLKK